MADRPSYLIIVTGKNGLELFSAHHAEDDAEVTRDRLEALLRSTGSQVHLIEVPQVDGVVKGSKSKEAPSHDAPALGVVVTEVKTGTKVLASPYRPATDAEFEEQTRQMLRSNGERDGFRDDSYTGAFS